MRKGRNRVDALFSQVETRVIGDEELLHMGFSSRMFRNLNTLADWQEAKAELDAGRDGTDRSVQNDE